jgi:ABC-2 type transport system ATP-binding protein
MDYAIEISGLHKEFTSANRRSIKDIIFNRKGKGRIIACAGVDLKVRRGELFGLVGPNGAGKTTLIKILSTIVTPDSGKVLINGFDVVKEEEKIRSIIGLVTSEIRSFYGRLTGRQNLIFFATLSNLSSLQIKSRIMELAQLLDLNDKLDIMFQEYSTGIKQRFAIARGLLNDASVLLIDEPTKSLDPLSAQNLHHLIKEELVKKAGKTVIFTSHSLLEIEKLADTVGIMNKGRLEAVGTLAQLRQKMGNPNSPIEEVFNYYVKGDGKV